MFNNVIFKRWIDGTVSVEIEPGKFLRKSTPIAPFELSDAPYHWGNWTKASEMFLSYVKLQTELREKAYRTKQKLKKKI